MRLYNTMSRRAEEFAPAGDEVKMYVCGITPYDHSHIGHAMSYIIFDVLRRYLEFRGFKVRHVQNYTDIDDRIIMRANALGRPFDEVAEEYIQEYAEEMRELNITPATIYPRATHEMPTIIEMVQALVEKGYAYRTEEGDVYFRVRKDPAYGKLSGREVDSLMVGARVEPGERKQDPADFALWKAAKPGEPAWDSPWGPGRPGWHIECSAMSYRYLGATLDIHGGGQDLIFPHHENEIAQSEAYTGVKPFVRYWLHNGWLTLDEEKMSKSLGNIITIREALDKYGADAIRIFVLTAHYRAPLTYAEESLEGGKRAAERLRLAATLGGGEGPPADIDPEASRRRFVEAMDDDLNTAGALATLFDLAREVNRARDEGRATEPAQATLRQLAGVLGLTLREPGTDEGAGRFIDLLAELRNELRSRKIFDVADSIRSRLEELGVSLEDTPDGTRWRRRG
ncbi:MAG: cysteine--tRNA ligase [Dehalococcoidia bacterium]|nr:cysteine--tRNA ligase [Dehalococcoidia bacterium]